MDFRQYFAKPKGRPKGSTDPLSKASRKRLLKALRIKADGGDLQAVKLLIEMADQRAKS